MPQPTHRYIGLGDATVAFLSDLESSSSESNRDSYIQKLHQLQARLGRTHWLDALERDQLMDFVVEMVGSRKSAPDYVQGWQGFFHEFFEWASVRGFALHPTIVHSLLNPGAALCRPELAGSSPLVEPQDSL